jgi:hypothetical protein
MFVVKSRSLEKASGFCVFQPRNRLTFFVVGVVTRGKGKSEAVSKSVMT